jgi:hypothetical protein
MAGVRSITRFSLSGSKFLRISLKIVRAREQAALDYAGAVREAEVLGDPCARQRAGPRGNRLFKLLLPRL